jgi:hypothetical protein
MSASHRSRVPDADSVFLPGTGLEKFTTSVAALAAKTMTSSSNETTLLDRWDQGYLKGQPATASFCGLRRFKEPRRCPRPAFAVLF